MGLDAIELVLTTEKHFGVSVPGEMVESALTVESLANVLFDLRLQTKTPLPYEKVLEEVRQLVAKHFRIPVEKVSRTTRFVQDLGLS